MFEWGVRSKTKQWLEVIEAENEQEEAEYGEKDLESKGGSGSVEETSKALKETMKRLNERLIGDKRKPAKTAMKQLEKDCLPRLEKFEEKKRILD